MVISLAEIFDNKLEVIKMLGDASLDGVNFLGFKKEEDPDTKFNYMGLRKSESGGNDDLGNVDILSQDNNIFASQHGQTHTQESEKDFNEMLDTQLPLLGLSL